MSLKLRESLVLLVLIGIVLAVGYYSGGYDSLADHSKMFSSAITETVGEAKETTLAFFDSGEEVASSSAIDGVDDVVTEEPLDE